MNRSIPLLRIAGIPIEINYSWILIFVLVSTNLAFRWFPNVMPGRAVVLYYFLGMLGSLVLFACVLAHELSHSLVAKRGGMSVRGIVLHVFGGVSLISEDRYTPALELKVAVAGPLLSVGLGALFLVLRNTMFEDPGTIGNSLLTYLYFINFSLAIFNLLPGFPLDGGRVLRSALALWKKDLIAATRIATRIGVLFAFALIAYGLFVMLSGNFWGLWTILIGIFLKDAAETSYRHARMQNVFARESVHEIMQQNPVIIPADITVQEFIDEYLWRFHHGSFPVANEKALGIVTFADIKKVPTEERASTLIRDVMHPLDDSLRTPPDRSIISALEQASNNGLGRLIVVDKDDRILGYLSLRDIARAFQYRTQLE
jgi:Zn-dependent protease/CBS domain-containing protein